MGTERALRCLAELFELLAEQKFEGPAPTGGTGAAKVVEVDVAELAKFFRAVTVTDATLGAASLAGLLLCRDIGILRSRDGLNATATEAHVATDSPRGALWLQS